MDQPALDQRLGTVGRVRRVAPEPQRSWSRTDHRYSRKRRRQAASTDIAQIKEGSTSDRTTLSPRREPTTNAPLLVFSAGLGYSPSSSSAYMPVKRASVTLPPIDSMRPRSRHRSAAALTRSDVSSPAAISSTKKDWWGADLPVARGQNNFDI